MRDYPLISDYIEAIKAAEDNCEQLKHLRPVLGVDGNPVMSSGNFAVVFKMIDENTGKFYAVKCFLKEQEGREEAYRLISEELNAVNSPYLTPIKYLDKELFVDSRNTDDTEFPVLLMDWVEGTPLDKYIQVYVSRYQRAENLDEVTASQEKAAELIANAYELDKLSYQFSRLAVWLLKQPFAHGDLKPDNILVKEDGAIVLVDYDGMYVPAMKGQKARELGSPDFRHPLRTIDDFDEHIDDFPLSSILLSLLVIATRPALFDEFGDDGRLLFTESDYRNLASSNVLDAIKPLIEDKNLTTYLSLFYLCSAQKSLFKESYHLFYLPEPIKPSFTEDENLSTKVTRNDFVHSWMDVYGYDETGTYNYEEYGLLYSEDKRRLLRCSFQITDCTIREGTKVICDRAFSDKNIVSIQIPDSVIAIGEEAFYHCPGLELISVPEGVNAIGDYAFADCHQLATIHLPQSLNMIGDGVFTGCNKLSAIYIPKGFKSIFDTLLPDYKSILIEEAESEDFSTEVTDEDLANAWMDELGVLYSADKKRLLKAPRQLEYYTIRKGTKVICHEAFQWCLKITTLTIPDGTLAIGSLAFTHCESLKEIIIPESILTIEDYAFAECSSLENISIPQSLSKFGKNPFTGCHKLAKCVCKSKDYLVNDGILYTCDMKTVISCFSSNPYINIPKSVTHIGDNAFARCRSLIDVFIPETVISIGAAAFMNSSIVNITIPDSITSIENHAFAGCKSLTQIKIPSNVTELKLAIFLGCTSLDNIIIPVSIKQIIGYSFANCKSLHTITILNPDIEIDEDAFNGCDSLVKVSIPFGSKHKFEEYFPYNIKILVEQNEEENLYTKVTDEDLAEGKEILLYGGGIYSPDNKRLLVAPKNITRLIVGERTKVICDGAFNRCFDLEFVSIPDGVTKIGKVAFSHCFALKTISIPEGVTSIDDYAFSKCVNLKSVKFPKSISFVGKLLFRYCDNLEYIFIPIGTMSLFAKILPEYKDKLVEKSNVVSISFDNSSTSKVDRCRVFKKDNDWKLEIVYKNGMKIEYPHSLLQGNQDILLDKQTIEKIQLYVGYCEGFYVNPKAVQIDFEYPSKFSAKILFDSDFIEISGITWGLNNNINEWKVKGLRSFNIEERLAVNRAEVVPSDYGNSVCFFMNAGGQTYIPLDKNSELCVGDALDMNTAKIITLCRKGKADIVRVME